MQSKEDWDEKEQTLRDCKRSRVKGTGIRAVKKALTSYWDALTSYWDEFKVRSSIKHIYGPENINYGLNELIVVCLVRDGGLLIKSFIEHYFSLGVRHIVFLDNNSADETVQIAKRYKNTTILKTDLQYKVYKHKMKQYLIKRFGSLRWALCADIDEFFDYPFSDSVDLKALLTYLNGKSYTAVVAQMLDMFSQENIMPESNSENRSIKNLYKFYDISQIEKIDYLDFFKVHKNLISNDEIRCLFGGIRKMVFASNAFLTKHPLIFSDGNLNPMPKSSHAVCNANVADFTCVLYHYKFLPNFYKLTLRAVQENSFYTNSSEYRKYLHVLNQSPNLRIIQSTSKEMKNVNDLVENQFLVVSKDYTNWVKNMNNSKT